jgi:hypothetical protein
MDLIKLYFNTGTCGFIKDWTGSYAANGSGVGVMVLYYILTVEQI